MKPVIIITWLFILLGSILTQAQLKEFEVRQEEPPVSIPIFPSNPDDAAVIIYSSIPDLYFESNTGGIVDIKGDAREGKYILIVRPERQIITVKLRGFKEEQIRLMSLEAKSVKYYSVEEKKILMTTEKGKFILNTIPQGAEFVVDGLPIKATTPYESDEFRAETYKITIKKNGYEAQEIFLEIEPGKIISKTVELTPDILFVDYTSNILSAYSGNEKISNVRFEQDGHSIVIYYNLAGDTQTNYTIEVFMRRTDNPELLINPVDIRGDVGTGRFVGMDRKIIWDIYKQYPNGLGDFRYNIELFMEEESGGLAWYYYVGGAIVAIGGVIAAVLSGGSSAESDTTPPAETLVDPPGRP
ncbi:MAG: hypothetical protein JW995_15710 [Melioribacteraceae bacterium]|nr:hypothetical protein [Melioribacteraceae bacterium]